MEGGVPHLRKPAVEERRRADIDEGMEKPAGLYVRKQLRGELILALGKHESIPDLDDILVCDHSCSN